MTVKKINFTEGIQIVLTQLAQFVDSKIKLPTVTIAGASQAGKTYFADQLVKASLVTKLRIIKLAMSGYYLTKDELLDAGLAGDVRNPRFDFDHPSSVDLKRLAKDILDLKEGKPISQREYIYSRSNSEKGFPTAERRLGGQIDASEIDVVAVEGLFVHYRTISDVADLTIFIDQPNSMRRLESRIKRDVMLRGYSEDVVRQRWIEFVEPNRQKYINPPDLLQNFKIDIWIENHY
jgi:uridine kinase